MFPMLLMQFAADCKSNSLLGLRPWNYYLDYTTDALGQCVLANGFELGDIWLIGAAVLEILVRIAGLIAVFFVIYGGFKYMTSQGAPEATAVARKTIINAFVGLVVSVVAATVVSFVAKTLTGGDTGFGAGQANSDAVQRVLSVIYALSGAIAAIMVIVGSLKFTTANGDPSKISSARNTIIYALVGIVVILAAALITSFVLTSL